MSRCPTARPQGRPSLAVHCERLNLPVPHRAGGAGASCVEDGAGILGPVCAEPDNLGDGVLICLPGHRPTDDRRAYKLPVLHRAYAEAVTDSSNMVTVKSLDEIVRLAQRQRDNLQSSPP